MNILEKFNKIFKGLDRAYGSYTIKSSKSKKVEGQAVTIRGEVTADLWLKHLRGESGLGIIPITDDSKCLFAAIDIDEYNIDLTVLNRKVQLLKLPLVLCRTKSGGVHLYLFLKEPVDARLVRDKLNAWVIGLGYSDSEIFPKQDRLVNKSDVGNWINMPYFKGDRTNRYALDSKGGKLTIKQFVKYAATVAIDKKTLIETDIHVDELFLDAPPCLQFLSISGFTEGTRNNSLYNLGVLAKKKYPDNWESKLDEYNQRFVKPPLNSKEVLVIVSSLNKKKYSYKCSEQPICQNCNKNICIDRKYGITGGSGDLGVVLGTLTKVLTDPVTWFLDVDGIKVQLTVGELLDLKYFRQACVQRISKLPNRIKGSNWDNIVRGLLKNVVISDVPYEMTPEGVFWTHLEAFCTEGAIGKDKESLLWGKPYFDEIEGKIYFRVIDLKRYLETKKFKDISSLKDIWNALKKRKVSQSNMFIKGKGVRVCKLDDFSIQTEDFTVKHKPDMMEC